MQQKWRLSKLEQEVSPFEVVSGGNRNMHAVTGPLSYKDENVSLRIDSLDAAVVSLGVMSPIYFSKDQPDLSKGYCQHEREQHDLVGSCELGELILGSIFGLKSEPQLAAALSPCTSFAQVDNALWNG